MMAFYSIPDLSRIFEKTPEAVRQWRRKKGRNGVKLNVVLRDEGIRVSAEQLITFLEYNSDLFLTTSNPEAKKLQEEIKLYAPQPQTAFQMETAFPVKMIAEPSRTNSEYSESSKDSEYTKIIEAVLIEKKAQMSRMVNELYILNKEIQELEQKIRELK